MVSDVAISPDDSEGVVLAKVIDLHIAIRSGCFCPGIGLVLAKEMKMAKEIRSGDKKRVKTGVKTPIKRRPGWVPGGAVVCWRLLLLSEAGRLLAFLGAGEARREGRAAGVMVCGDGWGGR